MKKIIFIGSTCVDVTIFVNHLPSIEEDVNGIKQEIHLGGCAHNAANIAKLFDVPVLLASPVGTGIYGDIVRNELQKEKVPVWQTSEEENGACYCFVNEEGNRSFVSVQGAEYHFQKEWLDELETDEDTWIYVCGLELENPSGENILSFVEHCKGKVCFATGPRISKVAKDRIQRMLKRANLIHLNAKESKEMTGCSTMEDAADVLYEYHHASVVITNGGHDVLLKEEGIQYIPSVPCSVIDGTGAGDNHIGTILACLCKGKSTVEAITVANQISSIVCRQVGACVDENMVHDFIID